MTVRLAPVIVCSLGLLLVMSGRGSAAEGATAGGTTSQFASNGTSGTSATSTTCSSSGTTTGSLNLNSSYSEPALTAVSGAEHVSQTSYRNSNGSVVSASKHVMTVSVVESNGWLTPNSTDSETSFWDTAVPTSSQSQFGSANPPQSVAAGLGRPGGLSQGTVRPGGTDLTFYVAQPGEMPVSGTAVSVPIATGGVTTPGLSNALNAGGTAQFSAASTGVLPGQTVTTVLQVHKWWHTLDTVTSANNCGVRKYYWVYQSSTYYRRFDFALNKLLAQATSIDTRRVYGQPDLDGEYPEDANAPQRNVTFNPWQWMGGMFAGNMPSGSGDNSGLARIQLYPGGSWDFHQPITGPEHDVPGLPGLAGGR